MKIGLIEEGTWEGTGTSARSLGLLQVFSDRGYEVSRIIVSGERKRRFEERKRRLFVRALDKIGFKSDLLDYWDWLSDELEREIKKDKYDVLMGRESTASYVLRKDWDCLKIFDLGNVSYLENYYSGKDYSYIDNIYNREMEIFSNVDYILCQHSLLTQYVKKQVFNSDKIVTVRLGCLPAKRIARFKKPAKLVFAGIQKFFPHNHMLLSYLTKISPYKIDCFGTENVTNLFFPAPFRYMGFKPYLQLDFLADYQFGLITVTRDIFRQYSPSTKFGDYFAHGLPVFFPEWMKEGYEYKGCIPYNEDNFVELIQKYATKEKWENMSKQVLQQAAELTWDKVLQPLVDIIEKS